MIKQDNFFRVTCVMQDVFEIKSCHKPSQPKTTMLIITATYGAVQYCNTKRKVTRNSHVCVKKNLVALFLCCHISPIHFLEPCRDVSSRQHSDKKKENQKILH